MSAPLVNDLTAWQTRAAIAEGSLSAVDVTRHYLARIAQYGAALNALKEKMTPLDGESGWRLGAAPVGQHEEVLESRGTSALRGADGKEQRSHRDDSPCLPGDIHAAYGVAREDLREGARLLGGVRRELRFLRKQHAEQHDQLRQLLRRRGTQLEAQTKRQSH